MAFETTYIMIKPDGVQRGLVGKIIERFERRGLKLIALKFVSPTEEILHKHYADLSSKPFFPALIKYMISGPVVCMVWGGNCAVKVGRDLLGATNPVQSSPGTIRGDFCLEISHNVCHGSDSIESAKKEIELWFKEEEICKWEMCTDSWIHE